MAETTYQRLAAHFDKHHKDPRGLDYLTGEQVVSRLNEVLGPGNWNFVVKEHGYDEESDEMWALGRLEAAIDGSMIWREQFGSQKHNRRRNDGKIIDYGFDAKGAATDALKKCASLIGVGLYLAEKEGGVPQSVPTRERDVEDADIVRSADDDLWKRWERLRAEALGLNVKVQDVRLPMNRSDLKAYGAQVKQDVDARKAQLAREEDARRVQR